MIEVIGDVPAVLDHWYVVTALFVLAGEIVLIVATWIAKHCMRRHPRHRRPSQLSNASTNEIRRLRNGH